MIEFIVTLTIWTAIAVTIYAAVTISLENKLED